MIHHYTAPALDQLRRKVPANMMHEVGYGRCHACEQPVFWHIGTMNRSIEIASRLHGTLRIICDACADSEKILERVDAVVLPDVSDMNGEDG